MSLKVAQIDDTTGMIKRGPAGLPTIEFYGVAGETFEANKTFIVRFAINGETSGRIYKATSDHENSPNKYMAIGVVQTTTEISASQQVTVIKFAPILNLKSGDTNFNSGEDGLSLFENKSGSFSTNPDAGITTGEQYASFIIGTQISYNATVTDSTFSVDCGVGGFKIIAVGA